MMSNQVLGIRNYKAEILRMKYCFLIFIKTIIYMQELNYFHGQIHKALVNSWLRVIPGCNTVVPIIVFAAYYIFSFLSFQKFVVHVWYATCVNKWNINFNTPVYIIFMPYLLFQKRELPGKVSLNAYCTFNIPSPI